MSVLAIDVGGTAIKIGIFGQDGVLRETLERTTDGSRGPEALVEQLCGIVREFPETERVGLSCTGQIDAQTGRVVFATQALPGFSGFSLRGTLAERIPVPVAVDNDVNCAAIGEARYGAGRGCQNFLCLTFGTGVGGAVWADGRLYRGFCGIAGEVGHIVTHGGGKPCVCGNRGCYEMYGSTRALCERVRRVTGQALNGREIFQRFEDETVRREIDGWIDEIVLGLASLTHAFNPQVLILGGGILKEDYVFEQLKERAPRAMIPSFRGVELRRAELGNNAGLYGAYCISRGAE